DHRPARPDCYSIFLHDALPISEEKHGFKFREQHYFKEMQNIYRDNSMLKLAYIDLSALLVKQNKQLEKLNEDLENIKARLENNRSKEHTSELQSRFELVCRLLH